MTRYDSEPARIRLGWIAPVAIALLVGLVVGRAMAGSDDGAPGDAQPPMGRPDLPSVYGHDRAGASAAAANLSTALAYSIGRGPQQVRKVAADVGTLSYATRVSSAYSGHQVIDPSARVLFRAVPITYRVLAYSDNRAEVRVWSVSILAGDDATPGAASFKTATIVVRWGAGGWRVDDVRDVAPGPTPITSQPSAGARFLSDLSGTEVFRVTP